MDYRFDYPHNKDFCIFIILYVRRLKEAGLGILITHEKPSRLFTTNPFELCHTAPYIHGLVQVRGLAGSVRSVQVSLPFGPNCSVKLGVSSFASKNRIVWNCSGFVANGIRVSS